MFYFSVKTIPLTKGYVAWVDDEDFDRVSRHKWSVSVMGPDLAYALRKAGKEEQSETINVYMHHYVMKCSGKTRLDHIKHRAREMIVDNRKSNLRPATHQQNDCNRRKGEGYTSKYKGVSRATPTKRCKNPKSWAAYIQCRKRRYFLGYFDQEEDAAIVYNVAAQIFFGEFASLNDV